MISGVILASGFSRRIGREKLLLNVGGIPLLERVIRAAQASRLDDLFLIYNSDDVKELGERCAVRTIFNPYPEEGQSAALKKGVNNVHPETDGFMFLVGDQPYLSSSTINTLISVFNQDRNRIVVPAYAETRGNPVIFPLTLKEELLLLEGDRGGRVLIDRMPHMVTLVSISGKMEATDVDTAEEYERIKDAAV